MRHWKSGQRSAVSEHEDRKALGEETGGGEERVGADEAGTAMALRGEHDARSASTEGGEAELSKSQSVNQDVKPIAD